MITYNGPVLKLAKPNLRTLYSREHVNGRILDILIHSTSGKVSDNK